MCVKDSSMHDDNELSYRALGIQIITAAAHGMCDGKKGHTHTRMTVIM